jgi:hypothetical protein
LVDDGLDGADHGGFLPASIRGPRGATARARFCRCRRAVAGDRTLD